MIQPVDLHRDLAGLPMLKERYGHPTDAESLQSFATLAAYRDGGIYATHFSGNSGWERHPHGDEVVQILEGATRFDIIVDAVMQSLELSAGMLVVVPQGCWHRFTSETGVKVLTVTRAGRCWGLWINSGTMAWIIHLPLKPGEAPVCVSNFSSLYAAMRVTKRPSPM